MRLIGSVRKSFKLRRISRALDAAADPSRILEQLQAGRPSPVDQAAHELFALSDLDPLLRDVLDRHGADRRQFHEIFELLLHAGAGQWVGGHYVAASTMAFAPPLDFVLTNAGVLSSQNICILLLEYFERGEVGPVPLEVRGPADSNDPFKRIWELEQEAKKKK